MKDCYVAQVQVIIDGKEIVIIPISGQGYDPNVVKSSAEKRARESYEGRTFTSMILSKHDYTMEEYKQILGGNPPWLGSDKLSS